MSGTTFTICSYPVIVLTVVSRLIGPPTLAMNVFVHTPPAFAAGTLLPLAGGFRWILFP
uniref:Uncharacterized protein n=1 Tax=Desulfovibrio sp. U5L TaxID=596152 RepID=I2PYZ1_9BACT